MKKSSVILLILLPFLALALFTPWSAELDLKISQYYYVEHHFSPPAPANWLYHYAIIPAWLVSVGALCIWMGSFLILALVKWRKVCLYLVLTLAIGSGVIVHVLLKESWGRPRPRETVQFGGQEPFRAYFQLDFSPSTQTHRSFACGHCTMGFYFFTLMLLGKHYRRRWLFWLGTVLTFGLGIALSWARIAQGGHFLSDTLVAALVMWITAFALYIILFYKDKNERPDPKTA